MIIHPSKLRNRPTELRVEVSGELLRSYLHDAGEGYEATDVPAVLEATVVVADRDVTLRGTLTVHYVLTCVRCTVERERTSSWPIYWNLLPQASLNESDYRAHELIELNTDDLDVSFYEDDQVDLNELIREAMILSLDHDAECGEKACDERLTELLKTQREAETEDSPIDPRWARLATLKSNLKN